MPDNKKITGSESQTFPPPPTPVVEQPQPGEPTASYFVVLHDAVGGHYKNAIVKADDLGDKDAIKRLLDLGAVRPLEDKDPRP